MTRHTQFPRITCFRSAQPRPITAVRNGKKQRTESIHFYLFVFLAECGPLMTGMS